MSSILIGCTYMWNIIKIVKKGDYDYALVPNHPKATKNGYVLLHRVVMENAIGRLLTEDEEVHHMDKNKHNNSISNLQLLTKEEHRKLHTSEKKRAYIELICPICGKSFIIPENKSFLVKKDKNYTCCCKHCGGKAAHMHIANQIIVRQFKS